MEPVVTVLAPRHVLRLSRAAGTRITVLGGRVWLTESGSRDDVFLSAGQSHVVAGNGAVVIEAMASARAPAEDARLMVWPAASPTGRLARVLRHGAA